MFNDPTVQHLGRLDERIVQRAVLLVNQARGAGAPLYISSSVRTNDEQVLLVKAGLSTNLKSKHLYGLAFDVDVIGYGRNLVPYYFWAWLGPRGEALGLTWGGRWKNPYDPGHFELAMKV